MTAIIKMNKFITELKLKYPKVSREGVIVHLIDNKLKELSKKDLDELLTLIIILLVIVGVISGCTTLRNDSCSITCYNEKFGYTNITLHHNCTQEDYDLCNIIFPNDTTTTTTIEINTRPLKRKNWKN